MKNTKVFLLCVLAAFVAGYLLGGFSASTDSDVKIHNLQNSLKNKHKALKKLEADGVVVKQHLKVAHDTVEIEKIKYHEIKPITYSVPELDSFFRARYEH
jgi:hypothetical protein